MRTVRIPEFRSIHIDFPVCTGYSLFFECNLSSADTGDISILIPELDLRIHCAWQDIFIFNIHTRRECRFLFIRMLGIDLNFPRTEMDLTASEQINISVYPGA